MLLQYSHSCLLLSCLPAGPRGRGPMPPPAFCAHGLRQSSGWASRRWWPCPTAPVPRWCRQHGDISAPGPACVGTGGFEAPRGASPATADGRVTAFESAFPSYLIACKNICHVRLVTGNLYQDRKERSNQRRDIAASEPPWHTQPGSPHAPGHGWKPRPALAALPGLSTFLLVPGTAAVPPSCTHCTYLRGEDLAQQPDALLQKDRALQHRGLVAVAGQQRQEGEQDGEGGAHGLLVPSCLSSQFLDIWVIYTCVCLSGRNISIYGCKIAEPEGKTYFSLICTFQSCSYPIRTTGLFCKSQDFLLILYYVSTKEISIVQITVVGVRSRTKEKCKLPALGFSVSPYPNPFCTPWG